MLLKIHFNKIDKSTLNDLFDFLCWRSYDFNRQLKLDQILESKLKVDDKLAYLRNNSPVLLQSVYGSTYQSKFRNNEDIYAISHTIKSMHIDDESIFAEIEANEYGELIDFERGLLRPVYYKDKSDDTKWKIATFDIDFNKSD